MKFKLIPLFKKIQKDIKKQYKKIYPIYIDNDNYPSRIAEYNLSNNFCILYHFILVLIDNIKKLDINRCLACGAINIDIEKSSTKTYNMIDFKCFNCYIKYGYKNRKKK